jgi:hypothetical protein
MSTTAPATTSDRLRDLAEGLREELSPAIALLEHVRPSCTLQREHTFSLATRDVLKRPADAATLRDIFIGATPRTPVEGTLVDLVAAACTAAMRCLGDDDENVRAEGEELVLQLDNLLHWMTEPEAD